MNTPADLSLPESIEETKAPSNGSTKKKKKSKKSKSGVSSHIAELKKKAAADKKKRLEEERENQKVGYVFEEELSLHKSHRKKHVE